MKMDKLVAIPQHYHTHAFDSKKFEVHQKYIDIQFIVSGSEKIYLGNPVEMTTAIPFNPEKDIAFLDGRGPAVNLNAGEFIPQLVDRLKLKNVEIRGDERAMAADSRIVPATEEDW